MRTEERAQAYISLFYSVLSPRYFRVLPRAPPQTGFRELDLPLGIFDQPGENEFFNRLIHTGMMPKF